MNANELTALIGECLRETDDHAFFLKLESVLRQQQDEIEELEKENTDLRYLIATKLEQQDGISLNSMAHPITNTPEPSYEIDLDKLETIEIDLPSLEPVAYVNSMCNDYIDWKIEPMSIDGQSLYTHPVKELTDEEIKSVWGKMVCSVHMTSSELNFARAILRKAQEK